MEILKVIVFYLVTYPIAGNVIGGAVELFWFSGFWRVNGRENFPKESGKIVLVSNHPGIIETVLVPGLFRPHYTFSPKYMPRILANKRSVFHTWWAMLTWIVWPVFIFVGKKRNAGDSWSLVSAEAHLDSGGNIVIFPEGARTDKVTKGQRGNRHLYSRDGNRKIKPLRNGFTHLVSMPGVRMVPVWVDSSTKTVRVGCPRKFSGVDHKEILLQTQNILLELPHEVVYG